VIFKVQTIIKNYHKLLNKLLPLISSQNKFHILTKRKRKTEINPQSKNNKMEALYFVISRLVFVKFVLLLSLKEWTRFILDIVADSPPDLTSF